MNACVTPERVQVPPIVYEMRCDERELRREGGP